MVCHEVLLTLCRLLLECHEIVQALTEFIECFLLGIVLDNGSWNQYLFNLLYKSDCLLLPFLTEYDNIMAFLFGWYLHVYWRVRSFSKW